jgi:hypothetical protein
VADGMPPRPGPRSCWRRNGGGCCSCGMSGSVWRPWRRPSPWRGSRVVVFGAPMAHTNAPKLREGSSGSCR